MIVDHCIGTLFIIILIMDFSNNFFYNVFHCHYPRCTSEFINDNGNMNFICLEVTQKIVNHFSLRHKIGGTNQ